MRQVPAERCTDIERATAGAVTCEELRPDLDMWAYLRNSRQIPPTDQPTPTPTPEQNRRTGAEPPHVMLERRNQEAA